MMKRQANTEYWFWVWLIQMTVQKSHVDDPSAKTEVWKNLVLIKAGDEVEAVTKAHDLGAQEEGDCDGTLKLWGEPAVTKFLGVGNIGLIHDPLGDGAEILWNLEMLSQEGARALVQDRQILIANLKRDLRR